MVLQEWKQIMHMDVLHTGSSEGDAVPDIFGERAAESARRFHQSVPGYEKTPLVELQALSDSLGVNGIYVKDESKRFGLNAFKGVGGSYAMFCILCKRFGLNPAETGLEELLTERIQERIREVTFVTATDGNHGKGVSWAAKIFGCRVYVYMPAGSAKTRAEAIRKAGPAEVLITDMNYDDTVRFASEKSRKHGWYLIQDTAWDGYEQIPAWIIQGYLTMVSEAMEQLEEKGKVPTHVFLQAGVGAMAGGVMGYLVHRYGTIRPAVTIVEPAAANCIYISAKAGDGKIHSVQGMPETIMAGLNCGTPCKITWPVLRDYADFYMSCPDFAAAHGMRVYAEPTGKDACIISGESGAATMGALCLLMQKEKLSEIKKQMGLDRDSIILLFNTEGDTDPKGYRNIVENGYCQIPMEKELYEGEN